MCVCVCIYMYIYIYKCFVSYSVIDKNKVILDAQLCQTLCNTMDCSPPGSSANGISQARRLEWVAIPFSMGTSRPRDQTHISYVSCIGSKLLCPWNFPGKNTGVGFHFLFQGSFQPRDKTYICRVSFIGR